MKLNNHGFGMREMIIYMGILLLFLLLAIYSINTLHRSLEKSKEEQKNYQQSINNNNEENEEIRETEEVNYNYYYTLEEKVRRATQSYLNDNPFELSTEIEKVTYQSLVDLGYISPIYDQFGTNECTAYSNVFQDVDKEYVIYTYINCSNYITDGY